MQSYHDLKPHQCGFGLRRIPTRHVYETDCGYPGYDGRVCCPVPGCGCEFVHIGTPIVHQDQSITIVGYDFAKNARGAAVKTMPAESSGRGSILQTWFYCESGHSWCHEYRFHKGTTSIRTLQGHFPVEQFISPDDGVAYSYSHTVDELWRD